MIIAIIMWVSVRFVVVPISFLHLVEFTVTVVLYVYYALCVCVRLQLSQNGTM